MPQIVDTSALPIALGICGFLTLMTLVLAAMVSAQRRVAKVSLGDGGDGVLQRRIRAHGNFVETAPFAMIGVLGMALSGSSHVMVWAVGGMFVLGRIGHAQGLYGSAGTSSGRMVGTMLSWIALAIAGITLLARAL